MKYSDHWIEDCNRWWGETLTWPDGHWCPDWDELPIDCRRDVYHLGCTCKKTLVGRIVGWPFGVYYKYKLEKANKKYSAEDLFK